MLVRLEAQAVAEFEKVWWFTWPGLYIISGFRTPARNAEVDGAPRSLHMACPSRAADLRVGTVEGVSSEAVWAILGGMWRLMGGRWGGNFRDPDLNHFDLGG